MKIIVSKPIVTWKLGKELVAANIPHNGMSLFGSELEIILVNENQAAQAQTVLNAHNGIDLIVQRYETAESNVRNVPGWATWTETQTLSLISAPLFSGKSPALRKTMTGET